MKTLKVVASLGDKKKINFEVTKKGELAVFVGGYFVFLKKTK